MTDYETMLKGLREGDEGIYKDFYDQTSGMAYSLALQMLKNEQEALDVLQDAYIKAYQKVDTLENPEKLVSWFNMIVANTCRDFLKKKKPVLFQEMDTEEFAFEDSLENENLEFVPEATADYNETKRLMKEILDNLLPEQRMCVLLYYYEELSTKEIAQALECSEGTVKSRLRLARSHIKEDVLDLEKKGTKLYGVAPIPFLIWMLKQEALAMQVPNIGAAISAGIGTAVTASGAADAASTIGAAGAAEAITHMAAEETVRETVGHSLLEGIGAFFAKLFTPKAVAVTVAAAVAVGGGVGGKAIYDNYQEEQELARQAAAEDAILEEIDEAFLENLFYYAPCFDEEHPVSDEEIYYLMQQSIVYKYMNSFEELSMPTVVKDEDVLEAVEAEEIGEPDYMILKKDAFHEILEKLQFNTPIDDRFFAENYPYSSRLRFEEDGIHWENPGLGGGFTSWDLELDDIVRAGGNIEVYYTLTETDGSQAHIEIEQRTSYRTATLSLKDGNYVIRRIVERPESTGGRSIVEDILGI